ncbi:hypothetical protein QTG54_012262 [Skeletonema marinoi]|uniref:Uncharacterized protein n=1 Tax=Skeletonema marinoi TaxID=267567 RepID=A0AAD8XZX2_9STRA|nr:hypothetical protein QTG54_012262 [Skeletonema marinoi]
MLLKHANKCRAWAQVYVGNKYFHGVNGFALDKEKGLKLIEESADQQAAILGQPGAQEELATAYNFRRNNEQEQILHYATLAASHGNSRACGVLGHFFMRAECGLTESLILGKHYSEKYFEDGRSDPCNPVSAFNLSLVLYRLGLDRFERIVDIPGHSHIPKSLFWARRALKGDPTVETNDLVIKFISMVENEAKSH